MAIVIRVVTILLIAAMISTTTVSEVSASEAHIEVLQGVELSHRELSQVEGKGLSGAVIGASVGAVAGLVTYTIDVAWDVYADGEQRDWVASDASKSAAMGAAGGFVYGLLSPSP